MNIKINDKNFLIEDGLTIFLNAINNNELYKQFFYENIFGTNFAYGSHNEDLTKKEKIFVVDSELFGHSTLGYFGQCLKLPMGVETEGLDRGFITLCFEKKWFTMLKICLHYLTLSIKQYDLIIFNKVDESFDALEKILFFQIVQNIAKNKPTLVITEDIASLKLSDIKFKIIDSEDKVTEFFKMIDHIERGMFNKFIQEKLKDEEDKRLSIEKKLAAGKNRRSKLQSQDKKIK